jgi:hypothetical protein
MFHLATNNLSTIPEQLGVYKLYALREDGVPIPIHRFAGIDNTGILYIGQTSKQTLKKRIYNLLATTRQGGNTTNHSGGLKYRTNDIIRTTLADHLLYFDFEVCDNPLEREKELLKKYASLYGEYPPLNK